MGNSAPSGDAARLGAVEGRVAVFGLDGAGKSALMAHLTGPKKPETLLPTAGVALVHARQQGRRWKIWDCSGAPESREMWPHVAENARALVFVVDASDVARFGAAREELRALLASPRIQEMQPPVLVMLNKVDRVQDVSEELRRSMREGSASRPRPAAGERARGRRRRRRRRRDEGSDEDEDEEEGEGEEGEGEEGEEEEEEGGAVEWTEEQTAQMRQRDPAMLLSKLPLLLATEALRVRHQYRFVETSAVTGRGIAEGINWLADKM